MAFKLTIPSALKQNKILIGIAVLLVALLVLLSVLFFTSNNKKAEQASSAETESDSEGSAGGNSEGSSKGSSEGKSKGNSEVSSEGNSKVSSGGSSEVNSGVSSEGAVPVKPVDMTRTGANINNMDLCIIIPENADIRDPNVPESKRSNSKPVTTFSNGIHTEVALHFSDNTIAKETITVLYLQAFETGDTPPEQVTYVVETGIKTTQSYTYAEIADWIIYSADGKLVLDVTASRAKAPQEAMAGYIAKYAGKPLRRPESVALTQANLLADGTYVYKYDWMQPAADYVRGHISEMILPIQYATPYSLEGLGYLFEMGASTQALPYLAAVSSSTVKVENEGGHSGTYTAVVYGGERLLGDYTVLQPTYTAAGGVGPTNPTSFSLLQAFRRADLERADAAIKFLRRKKPKNAEEDYYAIYSDGPFGEFSLAPELLENYVVFRDNDIVVYNFLDFAKPPSFAEQLKYLSQTDGYEQYGIESNGAKEGQALLLPTEGEIGRYIRKKV